MCLLFVDLVYNIIFLYVVYRWSLLMRAFDYTFKIAYIYKISAIILSALATRAKKDDTVKTYSHCAWYTSRRKPLSATATKLYAPVISFNSWRLAKRNYSLKILAQERSTIWRQSPSALGAKLSANIRSWLSAWWHVMTLGAALLVRGAYISRQIYKKKNTILVIKCYHCFSLQSCRHLNTIISNTPVICVKSLTATRLLPMPSKLSLDADLDDSIDTELLLLLLLTTFDLSPEKMLPATLLTVGDFFTGTTGFFVNTGGGVPLDFSSRFSRLFRKSVVFVSNDLGDGFSTLTAGAEADAIGPAVMSSTCFSSDFR